ncbi:MAG: prepilin-type N-terminal cleavage/methylation domain-containing protein, partial [Hydrogenoanaerobacterium sp.]
MWRKFSCKSRYHAGFTLSEVIVVIAIISVLMSVAIPGIVAMGKSINMMELDSSARQIALATQNRLTGAKSDGTLKSISEQAVLRTSDGQFYLSSGTTGMEKLLPSGTIDHSLESGKYIVVFNPVTGTVTEVYYSQKDFTPEVAFPLTGEENAKARKEAQLGYYKGDVVASTALATLPTPVLTVVNDENSLKVKINAGTPNEWRDKSTLTLHVQSVEHPNISRDFNDTVDFTVDSLGMVEINLDSMTEGAHFKDIFAGQGFTPGDNLRIWATMDPKDEQSAKPEKSLEHTANSLFGAYKEGSAGTNATVQVANARHLQNLDKSFSGVELLAFSVEQTAEITWVNRSFKAILNEEIASYDGKELAIRNITVSGGSSDAGLFAALNGTITEKKMLQNIRLVNPSVSTTAAAGALAGAASNVEVDNCFVYADAADLSEIKILGQCAGGLIGSAESCTVTYSAVGLPKLASTGSAGGFIGIATGTTAVNNCYAAVDKLSGGTNVAGFIGKATGVITVDNSYAVCNINAKATATAGFINGSAEVNNSYCAATYLDQITKKPLHLTDINGFGEGNSTCAYLEPYGATAVAGGVVKTIKYKELVDRVPKTNGWAKLSVADSHPYRAELAEAKKAYPFPALKQKSGVKMPHYGSWPDEPPKPVEPPKPSGLAPVIYYEKYESSGTFYEYGTYSLDEAGLTANNKLDNINVYKILETGYGVLVPTGQKPPTEITVDGTIKVQNPFKAVNSDITGHDLYIFTAAAESTINSNTKSALRSAKITVGDISCQINLKFGAAIAPDNTALGTSNWPLQTRIQKQLEAVQTNYQTEASCLFRQTHDITVSGGANWRWKSITPFGATYDGKWVAKSSDRNRIIGINSPLFKSISTSGRVDMLIIENADVDHGDDYSSVITGGIMAITNDGTINKCTVCNSNTILPESSGNPVISGFVGTNRGTILNSRVENVIITNKRGAASGFVGDNYGTITSCHVRSVQNGVPVSNQAFNYALCTISAERDCFGFIRNNTGTGKISKSSAVAFVKAGGYGAGFAEGNEGNISESYSNCLVDCVRDTSGFIYKNNKTVINCYAMLAKTSSGSPLYGFEHVSDRHGGTSFLNCYSASDKEIRQFADRDDSGSVKNCYIFGVDRDASGAQKLNLNTILSDLNNNNVWTGVKTITGNPFPNIVGNLHYGEWPMANTYP